MAPLFDLCGRGSCGVCNRFFGAKGRRAVLCGFQVPDHQGSKSRSGGVPRVALGGNGVSGAPYFTIFTCSPDLPWEETRWRDDGIGEVFSASVEKSCAAITELRDAIVDEPDHALPPIRFEHLETVPVTKDAMLAPLNEGVGTIVGRYDIVETNMGGANGEGA